MMRKVWVAIFSFKWGNGSLLRLADNIIKPVYSHTQETGNKHSFPPKPRKKLVWRYLVRVGKARINTGVKLICSTHFLNFISNLKIFFSI